MGCLGGFRNLHDAEALPGPAMWQVLRCLGVTAVHGAAGHSNHAIVKGVVEHKLTVPSRHNSEELRLPGAPQIRHRVGISGSHRFTTHFEKAVVGGVVESYLTIACVHYGEVLR